MLEIAGFLPVQQTSLEVDEYIPLTFQCSEAQHPVRFYGRTGDMVKQLFEIAINPSSGAIQAAVLVSYDRNTLRRDAIAPNYSVVVGLPECNLSRWRDVAQNAESRRTDNENRFSDEPRTISINKYDDSILVSLGAIGGCFNAIRAGRVDFLITERSELVGVHYRDLSRLELEIAIGR